MALIGNTVRVRATFKTFAGVEADPSGITLKFYDQRRSQVGATLLGAQLSRSSAGVYSYMYEIPDTTSPYLTYEFKGTLEGTSIVGRGQIPIRWT